MLDPPPFPRFIPPEIKAMSDRLVLGFDPDKEYKLGMKIGTITIFSCLSGLEKMIPLMGAFPCAASLVDFPKISKHEKCKTRVVHPLSFPVIDGVKSWIRAQLPSRGAPSRVEIDYRAVSSVDDIFASVHDPGFDVYFNFYADFFMEDPGKLSKYVSLLEDAKEGRIIVLFRYDRKKTLLSRAASNEVYLTSSSWDDHVTIVGSKNDMETSFLIPAPGF